MDLLKNVIKDPNIITGDYTYYDDNNSDTEKFEKNECLVMILKV